MLRIISLQILRLAYLCCVELSKAGSWQTSVEETVSTSHTSHRVLQYYRHVGVVYYCDDCLITRWHLWPMCLVLSSLMLVVYVLWMTTPTTRQHMPPSRELINYYGKPSIPFNFLSGRQPAICFHMIQIGSDAMALFSLWVWIRKRHML